MDIQSERKVSKEEAEIYSQNFSFKYFEISNKAYLNIEELFEDIIKNGEANLLNKEELEIIKHKINFYKVLEEFK